MKKAKTNRKRFLGLLLAVVMVLSLAPQAVLAADEPADAPVAATTEPAETAEPGVPANPADDTDPVETPAAGDATVDGAEGAKKTDDNGPAEANTTATAATEPASGDATAQTGQAAVQSFATPATTAAETAFTTQADFSQVSVSDYNGNYDGQEHSVAVTGVPDGYTVQYSTVNIASQFRNTEVTRKLVGSTTVYVRVIDTNKNIVWGPQANTITVTLPQGMSIGNYADTYDGQAHGLTVSGVPDGYSVEYSTSKTVNFSAPPITRTMAGTTTVYARVVAQDGTVILGPDAYTIAIGVPTGLDIQNYEGVYDGNAHPVNVVNVPNGYKVQYSTSKNGTYVDTPTANHTQTTVGTKNVYVRLVDTNGTVVVEGTLYKVTVTLPPTFTIESYSGSYDGQEHGLNVTVPSGYTAEYSTTTTASSFKAEPITRTEPGTTTVYVRVKNESGTIIMAATKYTVTVSKLVLNVQVANTSYTYGEPEPDLNPVILNPEVLLDGHDVATVQAAVQYSYAADTTGKTNSMSRSVSFRLDDTELSSYYSIQLYNYLGNPVSTVYMYAQQRTAGIIWGSGEYFEENGSQLNDMSVLGQYRLTYGDPIPDVYNNIQFAGVLEDDRDDIPFKIFDDVEVSAYNWSADGDLQFDGTKSTLNIRDLNADNHLSIGAYSYRARLNSVGDEDANGNTSSHMKYTNESGVTNLYINPKSVTVTPDNKTKVYGDPDPALTGADSGLAYNESIDYSYRRDAGELVGTYTIYADEFDYNEHKNYSFSYETGQLEITKRDLVFNGDSDTFTYDGMNHIVDGYTVEGLVNGDTISGTVYAAERTEVGTNDGAFDLSNIRITNRDGVDVTHCYNLIENPGEIEVTTATIIPEIPTDPTTPTTPTDPATPIIPAATTDDGEDEPADDTPAVANIEDDATPADPGDGGNAPAAMTDIGDNDTPLGSGDGAHWALWNLLLTIGTGIMMLVALIGYFTGKKRKEEEDEAIGDERENEQQLKRRGFARLMTIIPTLIAIIVFILTEDMRLPMVMTDNWTIWMAIIAVAQAFVLAFTKKKHVKPEDGEMDQAQPQNL